MKIRCCHRSERLDLPVHDMFVFFLFFNDFYQQPNIILCSLVIDNGDMFLALASMELNSWKSKCNVFKTLYNISQLEQVCDSLGRTVQAQVDAKHHGVLARRQEGAGRVGFKCQLSRGQALAAQRMSTAGMSQFRCTFPYTHFVRCPFVLRHSLGVLAALRGREFSHPDLAVSSAHGQGGVPTVREELSLRTQEKVGTQCQKLEL